MRREGMEAAAAAVALQAMATQAVTLGVGIVLGQAYGLRGMAEAAIWGPAPAPPRHPDDGCGEVRHRYRVSYEPPLYGCGRHG
jgi:hypothetical protein